MSLKESYEQQVKDHADKARATLSHFADRAVAVLEELAMHSDNDRVRLSAVNSILDRIGVVTPTEIKVTATPEEHALVRADAEETIAKLSRNMAQREVGRAHLSLEAVVLHEGEVEVLPIASSEDTP